MTTGDAATVPWDVSGQNNEAVAEGPNAGLTERVCERVFSLASCWLTS